MINLHALKTLLVYDYFITIDMEVSDYRHVSWPCSVLPLLS